MTTCGPKDLLAHSAWLRRLAIALARDADVGADLVQETWVAAWRHAPDSGDSLRPWLSRVMNNMRRMRWRSERKRHEREAAWAGPVASGAPTPEALMERHELFRRLAQAVSALPEPYRSTVLLCLAEGRRPVEVARMQGVPAGTVRWRLAEARKRLRAQLELEDEHQRRAWLVVAAAPLPARSALREAPLGMLGAFGVCAAVGIGVLAWQKRAVSGKRADAPAATKAAATHTGAHASAPRGLKGFLVTQPRPAVQNDPHAPDYDPRRLMPFAKTRAIFEAEPRDCPWAARMEARMEQLLLQELRVRVPEAQIADLTCRTSSCRVLLRLPSAAPGTRRGAAMVAVQRPSIAPSLSFEDDDGPGEVSFYALLDPSRREPDAYQAWYHANRALMAVRLAGPSTPAANRPASPPAQVALADPGPRQASCARGGTDALTAPVPVPETLSPLQELLSRKDPAGVRLENASSDLVSQRIERCAAQRREVLPGTFTLLRVTGWAETTGDTLALSRLQIDVEQGAPLAPAMTTCLERELGGTLLAGVKDLPARGFTSPVEVGFHLASR